MATLLFTGASGYIGSHTAYYFLKHTDFNIVVIDNLSTGFIENIQFLQECFKDRITFIKLDLSDTEGISNLLQTHKFDGILHFAASIVVSESVEKPLLYYANNTINTTNLINLCIKHNVSNFIFSSTAAVYGELDAKCVPISENLALAPINPYGASKMMSERVLLDSSIAYPSFKYVALRYFNVAGSNMDNTQKLLANNKGLGQRSKSATHLIKVACECASGKRESMSIFGLDYPTNDGTCIRDYIHIDDLAAAHLSAFNYLCESKSSNIFNVGYSKGYSVKEVIRKVKEISGIDFCVKEAPRRAGDPAELWSKNDKILSLTNWKPKFNDLDLIVKSAYEWEKHLK